MTDLINSPSLTELHPISNYGIMEFTGHFPLFHIFPPHFTSTSTGVAKAPVSVCVLYAPPFPRCVRAQVPSAGFLLSPLRGPQRLLIIPDLLALHSSSSRSEPLQLARPSSLLARRLPRSVCPPRAFKITPPFRLQSLIAAISDKGDV